MQSRQKKLRYSIKNEDYFVAFLIWKYLNIQVSGNSFQETFRSDISFMYRSKLSKVDKANASNPQVNSRRYIGVIEAGNSKAKLIQ